MNSILNLDATAQATLIRNKEIKPSELVALSIAAVEALNPSLNAIIHPLFEQAIDEAKNDLQDAPFKGVPIVLKDGMAALKGVPMTMGSALFKNYIPKQDSELVKRYKKAGFIIIGKTNMPEFGLLPTTEPRLHGATRNPYDLDRIAGGSSGGTAAAVAARMVAVGHGNDGGGSIRIPASCCGLFGLKPTRGRNPLAPLSEVVSGLVEEHVLTRSVRDSAAILDITGQPEAHAFYHAPTKKGTYVDAIKASSQKLKIGFSMTTPMGGDVHQDCIEATKTAVRICKELGHQVEEMPLEIPFNGKQLAEVFNVIWAVSAPSPLAMIHKMTGKAPSKELVEPLTYALYELGQKISGADYELARQTMHKIARSILSFFNDIDIWLSPTLGMPPMALGSFKQDDDNPMLPLKTAGKFSPMTALFNISGQPAASIPVYWNKEGLPIGVQVVSKFGDERTIFQLAAQMEEAINWNQYLPTVCA